MDRLTKKYGNGNWTLDASKFPPIDQNVLDSEIRNSEPIKAAVERLAEYEDAEEKGQLRIPYARIREWHVNEKGFAVCSCCHGSYDQKPHGIYLYNYCPHCGAKMEAVK